MAPRLGSAIEGPTHDEIAVRAHALYVARGDNAGNPEEDWLRAERELLEGRADDHEITFANPRRRAARRAIEHDLASK
jgi:hypothetical protein